MAYRKSFNALDIIRRAITENVNEGDICIDATAGRGNDTVLLAELAGESGTVAAFDIQQEAIDSTRQLLAEKGLAERVSLHLESHCFMDRYFEKNSVSLITFNFGWLPGGDHRISTKKDTSIEAVGKGLELLKKDGIMTLILYYGRDNGYEERDGIIEYLKTLDSMKYTVLFMPFVNRPNDPPIPIIIIKDQ